MLTKQTQTEVRGSTPAQWSKSPAEPCNATNPENPVSPATRIEACVGATIEIEGKIKCEEGLKIDGRVHGSIYLQGRRLPIAKEIDARQVSLN